MPHEHPAAGKGSRIMVDTVYVLLTILFFAVAAVYVHGCDRLR